MSQKNQKDKTLCFELDGRITGHVIIGMCKQDERKFHGQTYRKCIYTTTQDEKHVTNIVLLGYCF
jgi:hypothetical protein